MTLQNRLVGLLTTLVIIPMLLALGIGYTVLQNRLENFIVDRLVNVNQQKVKVVEKFFTTAQTDIENIVNSDTLRPAFLTLNELGYQPTSSQYQAAAQKLDASFTPIRLKSGHLDIKFILDDERDYVAYVHNPLYTSELGKEEEAVLDDVVKRGGAGLSYSSVFALPGTTPTKYGMYIAHKVVDQDKLTAGIAIVMLDLTPIYDEVTNASGLSSTGESFILEDDGYSAVYLTPLKYDQSAALQRRVNYGDKVNVIAKEAARGRTGHGQGKDYRGKSVFAAWAPISGLPWAVETKIDISEALSVAKEIQTLALLATVGIFLAVVIIVWSTINLIIERPLRSLQKVAEDLSNGNYEAAVDDTMLYRSDDFGKLATYLHHIAHRLKYEATGRKDQRHTPNDHTSDTNT